MEETSNNPNQHLTDYLNYFSTQKETDFAVLITAPWGAGKTYFIQNYLKQYRNTRRENKYSTCYISLNGVADTAQIDRMIVSYKFKEALLSDTNKSIKHERRKIASQASEVVSNIRIFGVSVNISNMDFLKHLSPSDYLDGKLVVFDDLERSKIPLDQLLGYINQLVEHGNQRVILIANETNIKNENLEEYDAKKEKLIGVTFEYINDLNVVLPNLLGNLENCSAKTYLMKLQPELSELFHLFPTISLRKIKYVLRDYMRFYNAIGSNFKEKEYEFYQLTNMFLLLNLMEKNNWLGNERFDYLPTFVFEVFGQPDRALEEISNENSLNVVELGGFIRKADDQFIPDNIILTNQLWVDIIRNNYINSYDLENNLANNPLFLNESENPIWYRILSIHSQLDDVFERNLSAWTTAFINREYKNAEAMLHMFGFRLFLSNTNIIDENSDEVIKKSKKYIDDILGNKHYIDDLNWEFGSHSPSGVGYFLSDKPQFIEILNYLKQESKKYKLAKYEKLNQKLMDVLKISCIEFRNKLKNFEEHYYSHPSLNNLNVKEFVEIILQKEDHNDQVKIFWLFGSRWEHNDHYKLLVKEYFWLKNLKHEFIAQLKKESKLTQYRIHSFINEYIDPTLISNRKQYDQDFIGPPPK
ncbi:MAG: hypothetical protein HRU29_04960 [Rhizobiales bacterium]|nr:KAP family NTPase [Hyphomicrobiales bacterium]NRB13734.1 hypothetical protein [Hyphomicrobiales bacterium]